MTENIAISAPCRQTTLQYATVGKKRNNMYTFDLGAQKLKQAAKKKNKKNISSNMAVNLQENPFIFACLRF